MQLRGSVRSLAAAEADRKLGGAWVCKGVFLPDGQLIQQNYPLKAKAFAEQQAQICVEPSNRDNMTFMDQIQAQLKQQKEGHDAAVQKLDDKIQLQTDENSRLWGSISYLGSYKLMKLASDVLSLLLAAVRARETQGPNDIWSKMMQKHPSFRNRLQAFCLDESCPLGEQGFPEAFNALRLQRNGKFGMATQMRPTMYRWGCV